MIRAAKLNRKAIDEEGEKRYLSEVIEDTEFLGSYELHRRSRQGVKARARAQFPNTQLLFPWLDCDNDVRIQGRRERSGSGTNLYANVRSARGACGARIDNTRGC